MLCHEANHRRGAEKLVGPLLAAFSLDCLGRRLEVPWCWRCHCSANYAERWLSCVCEERREDGVGTRRSHHLHPQNESYSKLLTEIYDNVRAGPRQKQKCDRFRVSELTPSDDIQGTEMPNTQDMAREYAPQSKCSINVGHLLPSSPPVPFLIFTHHCQRLPHHTLACWSISARTL